MSIDNMGQGTPGADNADFARETALGTSVAVLSVGMCVALLLLLPISSPVSGVGASGIGQAGDGGGFGENSGLGGGDSRDGLAATGQDDDGRGGKGNVSDDPGFESEDSSQTGASSVGTDDGDIAEPTPAPSPLPSRRPVASTSEFSIARVEAAPELTRTGSSTGSEGSEGSGEEVREFLGVKVKGAIALVCDVSGSMHVDFPVLYQELRKKFRPSTPLILVNGCNFGPPNSAAPPPRKGIAGSFVPFTELARDPEVYVADNTTDAIIFAVKKLRRRTVMFNSDLQDGGSKSAIEAFKKLRRRVKFSLSGRSLNCDAPKCLLDFIKVSGGDFNVDTINRTKLPAIPWTDLSRSNAERVFGELMME